MIKINPEVETQFNLALAKKRITASNQIYYRKWLRFYLDFCHKYHFKSDKEKSLPYSIQKLQGKRLKVLSNFNNEKERHHMPYDKEIDNRIQKIVSQWKGMLTKKMFGGVCHQLNGNILSGVHKDKLILRLGVDEAEKALMNKDVVPFDITGRPMKGWVMVEKRGFETDAALKGWLARAKVFVKTLSPK